MNAPDTAPVPQTGRDARAAARSGRHRGQTAGMAPGFVQGNLVILPERWAFDFLRFCVRNPRPCPVIGVGEPGDPGIPALGADIDLRSDVPRYRVWRDGALTDEPHDIAGLWRDDLVAFVLGCSFSFEEALVSAGLRLRHVDSGRNVSMYRTSLPTEPAGPFRGPTVVSMRPFRPADALRAAQITARFPSVHGAPIHIGDPAAIGIRDLGAPDYGDAVEIEPGETPVFWACGVTPQAALQAAGVDFCITHAPGCMLVTDRLNAEFAAL
ncbi:MAG: putative hydro-lyase [Thalassobaculum sp.]|uniref:putative hydro-lyase n=1 Tax=Thalassobaculum sp. TaxID=2022740 RepID=UPI0032EE2147